MGIGGGLPYSSSINNISNGLKTVLEQMLSCCVSSLLGLLPLHKKFEEKGKRASF